MIIALVGVSCVGKTTVGKVLAEQLGVPFEDIDLTIERQLGAPLARLHKRYATREEFRKAAAGVLANVLGSFEGRSAVIALPPRGLMEPYRRQLKGRPVFVVAVHDTAENILKRICFFDDDSRPLQVTLTPDLCLAYLREIRKDIRYFAPSFRRADLGVSIEGCSVAEAANVIQEALLGAGMLSRLRGAESGTEPER